MRILTVLLALLATYCSAQQKIALIITDSLFINENKSIKESEGELIHQLKLKALREAGAVESIQTYEHMYRSEIDRNYKELFSSSTLSELNGVISSFKIIEEEKRYNSVFNAFSLSITAQAEVLLYPRNENRPHHLQIKGIHQSYRAGEFLNFTILCDKPAWLYVFNLTDNGNYLIYPNPAEQMIQIQADTEQKFPLKTEVEYVLRTDVYPEINRLLFVTMTDKKPLYFLDDKNSFKTDELLFDWIFSTFPANRGVAYISFILTK